MPNTSKSKGSTKNGKGPKKARNIRGPNNSIYKRNGGRTRDDEVLDAVNRQLKVRYRNDLRGPSSSGVPLESIAVNPSIPVQVPVSANVFNAPIMGVISIALARGWSINTLNDNFPYWAFVYQAKLIRQIAQGGEPLATDVPQWLAYIIQSVIKKSVKFKEGYINYAMIITDTPDISFEQLIGPQAFKHIYSLGIKTQVLTNGEWPEYVAPSAYTDELGRQATQSLWLFFASHYKEGNSMHKLVAVNAKNKMTTDASAMAFFTLSPGGGQYSTGAWFKELKLEVDIRSPIFSVFSPERSGISLNRAYNKLKIGSCDGITLGCMLVDRLAPKQIHMKRNIVPQFVDFNEFLNVYSLTLQKALETKASTDFFQNNFAKNPLYYEQYYRCPLTFQEFALCLRAVLMLALSDTMYLQGIFPRVATTNSDNEFVTFVCGINTVPMPWDAMMLLPKMIQENILALRTRAVNMDSENPKIYMTALGKYEQENLNKFDYNVVIKTEAGEESFELFADDTGDVPISLIDGFNGLNAVGINDPSALVKLCGQFNAWLRFIGDTMTKVNSIAADDGVDALSVVGMTRHWRPRTREALATKVKMPVKGKASGKKTRPLTDKQQEEMLKEKDRVVTRNDRNLSIFRRDGMGVESKLTTIYDEKEVLVYASHGEIFQEAFSQFQQYWITPINLAEPTPQVGAGDNTLFNRIALLQEMGRQADPGTGSYVFATMQNQHVNYADLCFKAQFSVPSSQEQELSDLDAQNKGGALGAMAAGLIGELTKETVGTGIDMLSGAVGNLIPI